MCLMVNGKLTAAGLQASVVVAGSCGEGLCLTLTLFILAVPTLVCHNIICKRGTVGTLHTCNATLHLIVVCCQHDASCCGWCTIKGVGFQDIEVAEV